MTRDGTGPAGQAAEPTGRIILLLACAAFFSSAALRVSDALLPRLVSDFGVGLAQAAQIVTGFAIAYGLMQLVSGPLADRYGKTRMICVAVFGSATAALASVLAPGFGTLVAARVAWGMAAAGVIPLAMAWIGDALPYDQRQATLARFMTGTLSGMIAGQFVGGLFAESAVGWRGAFSGFVIGNLVVGILLLRHLRRSPAAAPPPAGDAQIGTLARFAAVLRKPWTRVVLLAVLCEGLFLLGPLAFMPAYLHDRFGVPIVLAAAVTAFNAVGGLAYALTATHIVRRLGERRMASYGGALGGGAFAALWLMPAWWVGAPLAFLAGFGTYLLHNTLQTHATQMAPEWRGTAVSLFAFCLFIGQAIGVAVCGLVIDSLGYAPTWITGALTVPLIGWGFAVALKRHRAVAG